MGTWVKFDDIKAAVSMEMVLGRYGVAGLRKNPGGELRGRCPIHGGKGSDSFHANTNKNNFQCFSCQSKGNVLDFVAAMEKCSVRDAALKLQDWFSIGGNKPRKYEDTGHGPTGSELAAKKTGLPAGKGEDTAGAKNEPLTFTLKGIDHSHAYLAGRGIDKTTAEDFGVGFFAGKGSMSGRVVIPVHNGAGELVAYAGRWISNCSLGGTEPKYKLPAGFHKGQELYNLHRAVETGERGLIVVEGFFDAMKVHQAGYPFVVALMGCSLSGRQEELLLANTGMVLLMLDGDEVGKRATDEIGARLLRSVFVKAITVPEGKQPDMMTVGELDELLGDG